ncbi:hypothetical protein SHIRM173S_01268 [Streptomyces hirsutus]
MVIVHPQSCPTITADPLPQGVHDRDVAATSSVMRIASVAVGREERP